MYYAQINAKDGLGNSIYTYMEDVSLHTLANGDLEMSIKKHDIFNGTKYDKILVTPKRIEFCDVGILIENHDRSFSVIVSDNPNGTIANIVKRDIEAAKQKKQGKEAKTTKTELTFLINDFAEILNKFKSWDQSKDIDIIYPHTVAYYLNDRIKIWQILEEIEIFAVPSITPIDNLKSAKFFLRVVGNIFEPDKILDIFMQKEFPNTSYYFLEKDNQKEENQVKGTRETLFDITLTPELKDKIMKDYTRGRYLYKINIEESLTKMMKQLFVEEDIYPYTVLKIIEKSNKNEFIHYETTDNLQFILQDDPNDSTTPTEKLLELNKKYLNFAIGNVYEE